MKASTSQTMLDSDSSSSFSAAMVQSQRERGYSECLTDGHLQSTEQTSRQEIPHKQKN